MNRTKLELNEIETLARLVHVGAGKKVTIVKSQKKGK